MSPEQLCEQVLKANLDLVKYNLVTLTWGNVSGIDRSTGMVAIKPSGIKYDSMTADDIVVVDLDGNVVQGKWKPSSDTATHLELYKAFPEIGGVAHTHSTYATMFAQACTEIACLGTTHADHFQGPVPVTRFLTHDELEKDYVLNTGKVILERFAEINPLYVPGVLVAGHAPFTWGENAEMAVENSFVLERIAQMALGTMQINPRVIKLPDHVMNRHFTRKHGPDKTYGQD